MLRKLAPRKIRRGTIAERFARDEKGVSAVEFGLISAVLMIIMLGVLDYAIALFGKMEMISAVRSGAQFALVNSASLPNITTAVQNSTNLDNTYFSVIPTEFCECSDGSAVVCGNTCAVDQVSRFIQIDGTYNYQPIFLPNVITMTTSTIIRVQ